MNASTATVLVALSEDTISRLIRLRRLPNEPLADIVGRLATSNDLDPEKRDESVRKPSSGRGRYIVRVLGESFTADTLAETLSNTFNALADLDSDILERLEQTGGRVRRNVARSRDAIHPGRPDLNKRFTQEIRPGWWIGTNYSHRDTCRIIEDACRISGLVYGRDVELVDKRRQ